MLIYCLMVKLFGNFLKPEVQNFKISKSSPENSPKSSIETLADLGGRN